MSILSFFTNLFSRKMDDASKILKNKWSVSFAEENGKPIIIRINKGLQWMAGDSQYPYRIWIAIPLLDQQENGLPSPEENLLMHTMEDEVSSVFSNQDEAFLCLIITASWVKEFVLYSFTDQWVNEKIELLRWKFAQYIFQYYVQKDEWWDVYKEYV